MKAEGNPGQFYSGRAGCLSRAGARCGRVSFELQEWSFASGPFWSRRRTDELRLAWKVELDSEAGPDEGLYESLTELSELERGVFAYKGVIYDIDWIEPHSHYQKPGSLT